MSWKPKTLIMLDRPNFKNEHRVYKGEAFLMSEELI